MYLTKLRKPVDAHAPWLAHSYRSLRDLTSWRFARQTAYGFSLAGDATIANASFEPGEAQVFLRQCENHDVVIDIGANVGFYSCLAASRGKCVVSFEPAQRNLKFLYENLWSNGFFSVEVFPVALGPKPGLMPLYGFGGIASLVAGWAQASNNHSHFASVTTLDTIVGNRFGGRRLLIKMDVEGFELNVLAGARKMLRQDPKPTWIVEILLSGTAIPGGINENFCETFEVFWSNNYRCEALGPEQLEITPDIVKKWASRGAVECGANNFLFSGQ